MHATHTVTHGIPELQTFTFIMKSKELHGASLYLRYSKQVFELFIKQVGHQIGSNVGEVCLRCVLIFPKVYLMYMRLTNFRFNTNNGTKCLGAKRFPGSQVLVLKVKLVRNGTW